MKVLLINGSPHENGNTFLALSEVAQALNREDIRTDIISIGKQPSQGCIACGWCGRTGRCTYSDELYFRLWRSIKDGNGALCALLDRLFYSMRHTLAYKPGASVIVCRREGASSAFDRLNKYFTMNNMPLVPSQNWNTVYGSAAGQAALDEEGMQTMRTLGQNMAWMLRRLAVEEHGHPTAERPVWTDFIR